MRHQVGKDANVGGVGLLDLHVVGGMITASIKSVYEESMVCVRIQ